LQGCKLNPKTLKQEFLIIESFNKPEKAQQNYQKRWQIEMCFKAMKSSGFDSGKNTSKRYSKNRKINITCYDSFCVVL
jgi:IS4 transposase